MARLTKWAIFMRAFMSALLAGSVTTGASAQTNEEADWSLVQRTGTPEAYFLYLRRYPRGGYVTQAMDALSDMGLLEASASSGVEFAETGFQVY